MTRHDFTHVPVARSFMSRLIGVIGKREYVLFIPRCTSIHTCLLREAIDVVFLDERSIVAGIRPHARPWRVVFGPRGTHSVLELPADHAAKSALHVGDEVAVSWP